MDLFGKWEFESIQAKEDTELGFLPFENVL